MKGALRAIIFDFGGVLLDWDPRNLYRRFFPEQPEAMEAFLAEINFSEWNAAQDGGRPLAEGVRELSSRFPQYAYLARAYHKYWEASINGPVPGSADILQRLKTRGFALYGLSNWSSETFPIARAKYEIFNLFDDIVISGEAGLIKPDPAIFTHLLRRIGRLPGECLFIDDSLPNVQCADRMGFAAVHFRNGEQLQSDLIARGVL